jgi:hypothetical protein
MPRVGRYDSGDRWDDPNLVWDGLPQPENHTMSDDNRISQSIAAADKTAVQQKIEEIWALLPFLVNIPAEDKNKFMVIGTARAGMDEAFQAHMTAHPELVPGFVNLAEVTKDKTLRTDLGDLLRRPKQLVEAIQDTMTLANSDTIVAYLAFYSNVKSAAKRNVPGADAILTDLARFFPTGRRAASNPTPPTP